MDENEFFEKKSEKKLIFTPYTRKLLILEGPAEICKFDHFTKILEENH